MTDLRGRLKTSLAGALRARDPVATAALRSAMSALANAEAVHDPVRARLLLGVGAGDVTRRDLSPKEVIEVVRAEITDRLSAADQYERLGRVDEASRLQAEAAVLEVHLQEASGV